MRLGLGMTALDAWKAIWSARAVNVASSSGASGIGSASASGAAASAKPPTAAMIARRAHTTRISLLQLRSRGGGQGAAGGGREEMGPVQASGRVGVRAGGRGGRRRGSGGRPERPQRPGRVPLPGAGSGAGGGVSDAVSAAWPASLPRSRWGALDLWADGAAHLGLGLAGFRDGSPRTGKGLGRTRDHGARGAPIRRLTAAGLGEDRADPDGHERGPRAAAHLVNLGPAQGHARFWPAASAVAGAASASRDPGPRPDRARARASTHPWPA